MGLKIIRPLAVAVAGGGTGLANLATSSPREVWATPAEFPVLLDLDLGAAVAIDSVALIAINAAPAALWQLERCTGPAGQGAERVFERPLVLPGAVNPTGHAFAAIAPEARRWWRIKLLQALGGPQLAVGRLVVGLSFEHATSLGGGRLLVDPAPRQAFADGGFGVGEGTVKRIVRWRFEDLGDDDVERMERLAEDRGTSRPLVVVEHRPGGPRAIDVHYGLFGTFEANERADPKEWRWPFSLEEWR